MAGFCAPVRNGWNEKLTHVISFVGLIGAVGLAVTKPVLGDAGVVVVTVKFPYVTQDVWMAWAEGWRRRQKRCSMRWWYWANTCMSACFGRKHALGVHYNRSEWRRRDFCHFQCKCLCAEVLLYASSMQEVGRNTDHISESIQSVCTSSLTISRELSLSQRHVFCRPQFFIRTGGHTFLYRKNMALPRRCSFDSYSVLTKTRCPSWLGKLLQRNSTSLFLSFCLLGIVLSLDGGTGEFSESPVN